MPKTYSVLVEWVDGKTTEYFCVYHNITEDCFLLRTPNGGEVWIPRRHVRSVAITKM